MTKLRVKTTGNYTFEIKVELDDTVADVKRTIENSQGADFYAANRLLVVHSGRILKDETTLKENGVTEESLLVLVILTSSKLASECKEAVAAACDPPDAGASSTGQSTDSAAQTTQPTGLASTGPNVTPLNLFPQLVAMGYRRELALEAFLLSDKNEEQAAIYLSFNR